MKLYEINEKYSILLESIENGDIPEECIKDTLDSVEGELIDKLDNIVSYIKQLKIEKEGIKEEVKNLQERVKQKENKIKNLEEYVFANMKLAKKNKVETSKNIIRIAKNPASIVITDEEKAIEYLKEVEGGLKIKTEISKTVVKELLKKGEELEFANLRQSEGLRIK